MEVTANGYLWTHISKNPFFMTNKTSLIQYKEIQRILFRAKMVKMDIMDSEICTHCTPNTADNYIHNIWYCPPILHFCQRVTIQLSLLLNHYVCLEIQKLI